MAAKTEGQCNGTSGRPDLYCRHIQILICICTVAAKFISQPGLVRLKIAQLCRQPCSVVSPVEYTMCSHFDQPLPLEDRPLR